MDIFKSLFTSHNLSLFAFEGCPHYPLIDTSSHNNEVFSNKEPSPVLLTGFGI